MCGIDRKHSDLNALVGAALGPQQVCPDAVGRYQHFERGSIHWHPKTGAHETHGAIRSKWADLGWECGFLGYPTSDECDISEWDLDDLTNEVHAAVRDSGACVCKPEGFPPNLVSVPQGAIRQLGIDPSFARISYFQQGAIAFVRKTGETITYVRRKSRQRYQTFFELYSPLSKRTSGRST